MSVTVGRTEHSIREQVSRMSQIQILSPEPDGIVGRDVWPPTAAGRPTLTLLPGGAGFSGDAGSSDDAGFSGDAGSGDGGAARGTGSTGTVSRGGRLGEPVVRSRVATGSAVPSAPRAGTVSVAPRAGSVSVAPRAGTVATADPGVGPSLVPLDLAGSQRSGEGAPRITKGLVHVTRSEARVTRPAATSGARAASAGSAVVSVRTAGGWRLTTRGMAVVICGFVVTMALGVGVILGSLVGTARADAAMARSAAGAPMAVPAG